MVNLKEAIGDIKLLQKKLKSYDHVMWLLGYDQSTCAPRDSAGYSGETAGIMAAAAHSLLVSKETGEKLDFLQKHEEELDFQTQKECAKLRLMRGRDMAVPEERLREFNAFCSRSASVWQQAKRDDDYPAFEPYMQGIVEWSRELASYRGAGMDPYEYCLREAEPDFGMEQLDPFFDKLQSSITPLIREVQKAEPIDDSFMYGDFPIEKQRQLGEWLMDLFLVDKNRCILAESEHPFTNDYSNRDVRITTHYYRDNFKDAMMSTIHETGHALSYLLAPDCFNYSILYGLPSGGFGEGQSRLQENIVGRSREFISFVAPKLRELFPENLGKVSDEQLYRAMNKSQPSLIRIKADELTYSLHIMVRYQVEKELMRGELKAEALPRRWNELMEKYLGVKAPNDTLGCLQDMHWSGGVLGSFVSYALGNATSVQLKNAMEKDIDLYGSLAQGDCMPHLSWLRDKVYCYGSLYSHQELMRIITGEELNVEHYIKYLEDKYTKLYNL